MNCPRCGNSGEKLPIEKVKSWVSKGRFVGTPPDQFRVVMDCELWKCSNCSKTFRVVTTRRVKLGAETK